jgi:hypothetical protein
MIYRAIYITTRSIGCRITETFYIYQPIKYQHILISNNLYLCVFKLWVAMIVILYLRIGSDISLISFYMYLTFVFHLPEDGHMVGRNM